MLRPSSPPGPSAKRPAGKGIRNGTRSQDIPSGLGDLMSFRQSRTTFAFFLCLFLFLFFGGRLCAQAPAGEPPAPTGGLSGLVRDRSGAVVAAASVSLTDGSGASH